MTGLLGRCTDLPMRALDAGEVLIVEGRRDGEMYVMVDGAFEVTKGGTRVGMIVDSGAVIGEISALLDTTPGATVTATAPSRVHVVDDPVAFMAADSAVLLDVSRTLAERLNRLVAYLADVKAQYAEAGGHLELLDAILAELTFGRVEAVESGSEREPDPYY